MVALGIAKVTAWLIFQVIVINWPLVIIGVVVGAILIALGGHGTFGLQARLRQRFRERLIPKIKESIIGESFELNGKQLPSVRCRLKELIERGKAEALCMLAERVV
jgi:hypothetical protein